MSPTGFLNRGSYWSEVQLSHPVIIFQGLQWKNKLIKYEMSGLVKMSSLMLLRVSICLSVSVTSRVPGRSLSSPRAVFPDLDGSVKGLDPGFDGEADPLVTRGGGEELRVRPSSPFSPLLGGAQRGRKWMMGGWGRRILPSVWRELW